LPLIAKPVNVDLNGHVVAESGQSFCHANDFSVRRGWDYYWIVSSSSSKV
jgi:hypothetical protein